MLGFLLVGPVAGAALEETGPRTVSLADFDRRGSWRVRAVEIQGLPWLEHFTLGSSLQTQARPWWAFWRDEPEFVPGYLHDDLEIIRAYLQGEGYYEGRIDEKIIIRRLPEPKEGHGGVGRPGEVEVRISIEPGSPVLVCSLYVDHGPVVWTGAVDEEMQRDFPLRVGQRFSRSGYEAGGLHYSGYLADHGYPAAEVHRHARVDVRRRCAEVAYGVEPGPYGVFGETTVSGLKTLDPDLVRREIAYRDGEPYDASLLTSTRARLRDTRLFSLIRVTDGEATAEGEIPIDIEVAEGPQHEIRMGVGYGTEDGVRAVASWWNYDFLGDNRRLGISGKISQINRWIEASLTQPHFPRRQDTASISFTLGQQDESTYLDNSVITTPKIAWWADGNWTAATYFSFRYDSLSDVSDATIADLGPPGEFQKVGFTNTFGVGFRWSDFDDTANPTRGFGVALAAEISGGILGADFNLLRLIGQAAYYQPLPLDFTLALKARGGSIVPYDSTPQVPLWSRLYAGGNAAFPVRGYGRRRVGPMSGSDDPLGGRTALVGSVELMYPLFGPVMGVLFFDGGDVELSAWTFRPANLQKGVGFGARAATPVGPVSIDFGFGLDRVGGDSLFHIDFTIGPQF